MSCFFFFFLFGSKNDVGVSKNRGGPPKWMVKIMENPTRWAPTSYKLSHNPYKWPYKRVTGVITLLIGVITQSITGRGPPCIKMDDLGGKTHYFRKPPM